MRSFKKTLLKVFFVSLCALLPVMVSGYNGWKQTTGYWAAGRYNSSEFRRSNSRMRFGIYYGRPYWYRPHYFYYPYRPYYKQGEYYQYRRI